MYLQGKSILGIQRELEIRAIKSPTGKDKWSKRTIDTMLSNEKYSGDVIIFKTFSDGFPNTKRKVNEPVQHTKYQSVGSHPAILSKEVFNAVQAEKARRSNVIKGSEGAIRKSIRYSSLKGIKAHD
jgi:site-specific DNA recombinase